MEKSVYRNGIPPAVYAILATLCISLGAHSPFILAAGGAEGAPPGGEPVITILKPERAEGRGYRLEYTVDAPLDITWKFKTDFDNKIVLTNKMVLSHRVVSQTADSVITESVQSNKPKTVFRWKTLLFPDQHRLEFVLLDPDECGMDYLYGNIRLQAAGSATRITQVAYMDFFGVSLWVHYPFHGGLSQTLTDTVHWEQQAVLEYWQSLGAD